MLMRTDPFRDIDLLTEAVWCPDVRPSAVPLTAYLDGGTFIVHADLPGVSPELVDVTMERNVLTVRAKRTAPLPETGEQLIDERAYAAFSRQLILSETWPSMTSPPRPTTSARSRSERAKPRKIKVEIKGSEEVRELTA